MDVEDLDPRSRTSSERFGQEMWLALQKTFGDEAPGHLKARVQKLARQAESPQAWDSSEASSSCLQPRMATHKSSKETLLTPRSVEQGNALRERARHRGFRTPRCAGPETTSSVGCSLEAPTAMRMRSSAACSLEAPTAMGMRSSAFGSVEAPSAMSMRSSAACSLEAPTATSMQSTAACSLEAPAAASTKSAAAVGLEIHQHDVDELLASLHQQKQCSKAAKQQSNAASAEAMLATVIRSNAAKQTDSVKYPQAVSTGRRSPRRAAAAQASSQVSGSSSRGVATSPRVPIMEEHAQPADNGTSSGCSAITSSRTLVAQADPQPCQPLQPGQSSRSVGTTSSGRIARKETSPSRDRSPVQNASRGPSPARKQSPGRNRANQGGEVFSRLYQDSKERKQKTTRTTSIFDTSKAHAHNRYTPAPAHNSKARSPQSLRAIAVTCTAAVSVSATATSAAAAVGATSEEPKLSCKQQCETNTQRRDSMLPSTLDLACQHTPLCDESNLSQGSTREAEVSALQARLDLLLEASVGSSGSADAESLRSRQTRETSPGAGRGRRHGSPTSPGAARGGRRHASPHGVAASERLFSEAAQARAKRSQLAQVHLSKEQEKLRDEASRALKDRLSREKSLKQQQREAPQRSSSERSRSGSPSPARLSLQTDSASLPATKESMLSEWMDNVSDPWNIRLPLMHPSDPFGANERTAKSAQMPVTEVEVPMLSSPPSSPTTLPTESLLDESPPSASWSQTTSNEDNNKDAVRRDILTMKKQLGLLLAGVDHLKTRVAGYEVSPSPGKDDSSTSCGPATPPPADILPHMESTRPRGASTEDLTAIHIQRAQQFPEDVTELLMGPLASVEESPVCSPVQTRVRILEGARSEFADDGFELADDEMMGPPKSPEDGESLTDIMWEFNKNGTDAGAKVFSAMNSALNGLSLRRAYTEQQCDEQWERVEDPLIAADGRLPESSAGNPHTFMPDIPEDQVLLEQALPLSTAEYAVSPAVATAAAQAQAQTQADAQRIMSMSCPVAGGARNWVWSTPIEAPGHDAFHEPGPVISSEPGRKVVDVARPRMVPAERNSAGLCK